MFQLIIVYRITATHVCYLACLTDLTHLIELGQDLMGPLMRTLSDAAIAKLLSQKTPDFYKVSAQIGDKGKHKRTNKFMNNSDI